MMQVENEYGSFGQDHDYLRSLAHMMREEGVTVPFFTSDGAWDQCLRAGVSLKTIFYRLAILVHVQFKISKT